MNSIKKMLTVSLITLTIVGAAKVISSASEGSTLADEVRLRKNPKSDSIVLELIPKKGDEVEVLEISGDWYKVKYQKITGYVHKDYLTVKEEIKDSNSEEKEEQKTNEEDKKDVSTTQNIGTAKEIYTVQNKENVYIHPTINANVVTSYEKDTKVKLIQKLNKWAYVEANSERGWIPFSKLTKSEEIKPTETTKPVEPENKEENLNKTGYVTTDGINFRKEANTDSQVLRVMITNLKVNIIKEEGDWYKVTYKDQTGYILKKYVSEKEVKTTSRSSTQARTNKQTTEAVAEPKEEIKQTSTVTSSSNKGQEVVEYAKQYLGSRYVYGGSSPKGFDCSGFTMYVYKHFGVSLSHSATAQSKVGQKIAKSDLQPGDLVFFKNYRTNKGIGHVGIYIGNNKFIHASTESTGVITSSLLTSGYQNRYVSASRVI